jgi:hypothetical protein
MKTRLITWLITLGALLDTLYGVFAENSGLLSELGVSPKVTKIVLLLGIIWTAFSKSLKPEPKPAIKTFADSDSDGAGTPDRGL